MRVKGTSSKRAHRVPTLFWHAWACYVDMWHWSDGCAIDRATAVIRSRHSGTAISGWQWQLTLYTETDRREKRPRLGNTHTHITISPKRPWYWHGTLHTPVALEYHMKIKQLGLIGKMCLYLHFCSELAKCTYTSSSLQFPAGMDTRGH